MPLPAVESHRLPFPIETDEAKKFWASRHICNRAKAIIAFSTDRNQAMRLMRRYLPLRHQQYHFRERAWNAWQYYVDMPDMAQVPFTPLDIPWWECLPREEVPPPSGHWALWMEDADEKWLDEGGEKWIEWIDTTLNP